MEEEQIKLRKIDDTFGEGKYLSWKDKDVKKVLLTNWGVYDKSTDNGSSCLSFRCNVLNIDGKKYLLGSKIIDTTSINFHQAIKPFLQTDKTTIHLKIKRIGEKKKTSYEIEEVI